MKEQPPFVCSADEALARLIAGNGQRPFATILGCSDSRVVGAVYELATGRVRLLD